MPGRTIAIGDIHGCSEALTSLLNAIEPGPDDLIVTLGDYIDRGPDSRGAIEQLIALRERCQFVPLRGNHDQIFLDVLERRAMSMFWVSMGGLETLGSYGAAWGEFDRVPGEHVAFLQETVPFFETDGHFFIHAQYDPNLPLDQQPEELRLWRSLRDVVPAPHRSGKRAIVGHTGQKSGDILDLGHILCIDTRCYGGGWLTALEIATGRLWQADMIGRLRGASPPQ